MDSLATPGSWMEPTQIDMDRLSYEIFSILESKFLFGYDDPKLFLTTKTPAAAHSAAVEGGAGGKVRILSIDAAADGLLAGASLTRLEAALRKQSGDPGARIADFFDLAAGSGAGGFLAALLFTRGPDGRPLCSAADALRLLTENRRRLGAGKRRASGLLGGILRRSAGGVFRRMFGDATLRDAVKPLLIPCYDLASGAAFVFSRADAAEADGYDFLMEEVCAATCADPAVGASAVEMRSLDGRTRIRALGGAVAMGNPTAAAITHVLNNRREFPSATRMEDLLVISLGGGECGPPPSVAGKPLATPSAAELAKISGGAQADMVDQAVAMAFGDSRITNYVRIQGCRGESGMTAEAALLEKGVESTLFRGRRLSDRTIVEKLDSFAGELIEEKNRRKTGGGASAPTVEVKPTRSSSSSSTFAAMAAAVTSGLF